MSGFHGKATLTRILLLGNGTIQMHTVVQRFWKFLLFSSSEQNYYNVAPVNKHSQISGQSLYFESGGSKDQ
jgi:hypothetical protein